MSGNDSAPIDASTAAEPVSIMSDSMLDDDDDESFVAAVPVVFVVIVVVGSESKGNVNAELFADDPTSTTTVIIVVCEDTVFAVTDGNESDCETVTVEVVVGQFE